MAEVIVGMFVPGYNTVDLLFAKTARHPARRTPYTERKIIKLETTGHTISSLIVNKGPHAVYDRVTRLKVSRTYQGIG